MADTFGEKVTALSGGYSDATEVGYWLTDGVVDVIRRIKQINPTILSRFASNVNIPATGVTLDAGIEILDVRKGTYEAVEIPSEMRHRANRSTSLHRATTKNPKFYKLNNILYVLPTPAVDEAYASQITFPKVIVTDTSISAFPDELYYLVVIYGSLQNLLSKMVNSALPSDVILPTVPVMATFISTIEILPVYTNVPNVVLPTIPSDANIDYSGVGSTPIFINPNPPVLPILDLGSDLSLSAFTSTLSPPVMSPIDITDGAVADFGTVPIFVAPILSLTPAELLSTLIIPPIPTVDFTIDKALTTAVEATGIALPTLTIPTAPTITTLDIDAIPIPVAPADPSFTTPTVTMAPVPIYSGPTKALDISAAMSTITTQIEPDQDVELAAAKIEQVRSAVQDFATETNNSLNEFNESNTVYQAELQKEIEEARLINTKESSEYAAKLDKYRSNVQVYTARINAQVQQFASNEVQYQINLWANRAQIAINEYQVQTNSIIQKYSNEINSKSNLTTSEVTIYSSELQRKTELNRTNIDKYQAELTGAVQSWQIEEVQGKQAKWIAQRTTEISKYQTDIQNALQEFNSKNIEYQATIQKNITEAANKLTSESEELRVELQKYGQEVEQYRIDVNTEVQVHLQKDVNAEVTEWVTRRENLLREFQIKSESTLQQYATALNENTQSFNAALQVWVQQIQQAIATFGAETGKYSAEVQGVVSKHAEDIRNEVEEFRANLDKYLADLNKVTEHNQRVVNAYIQDLVAYQSEVGALFQDFNAKLQRVQVQYTWYIDQYNKLLIQYERGFIPFQLEG